MKTYKLHLIRHGKTAANLDGRYIGRTDLPLSPLGEAELLDLRNTLGYPHCHLVYTSPLARCRESAAVLYPGAQVVPLDDLGECDLGEFEGKTPYELRESPAYLAWMRGETPPGGESSAAFAGRSVRAFAAILDDLMQRGQRSAAVVTHSGVIMSILGALGLPRVPASEWKTQPGCGYTVLIDPAMWMRSGLVEVFRSIPAPPEADARDYGVYAVEPSEDDWEDDYGDDDA